MKISIVFYLIGLCLLGFLRNQADAAVTLVRPSSVVGCQRLLSETGAATRYVYPFGSEIAEIRMSNRVLYGPWYTLGVENQALLFVKKNEQVFARVPTQEIDELDLSEASVAVAPELFAPSDQRGPTCLAAAVCNLLADAGKAEKLDVLVERIYRDPLVRPGHPETVEMILHDRELAAQAHFGSVYSLRGLSPHLRDGGVAIYGYDGNHQVDYKSVVLSIENDSVVESMEVLSKFVFSTSAANHRPRVGHSIFVKGELPDGRLLVANWGRWQILELKDLASPLSSNTGFVGILGREGAWHLEAQDFPNAGDYIEFTARVWHRSDSRRVRGIVLAAFPSRSSEKSTGVIEIMDEISGQPVRVDADLSEFRLNGPIRVDRRPRWSRLFELKAHEGFPNLTEDAQFAVLRYWKASKRPTYRVGQLWKRNGKIWIRELDSSDFHELDQGGLLTVHGIPSKTIAGSIAEAHKGVPVDFLDAFNDSRD